MRYFIGLDLGGTNVSTGLVDESGQVVGHRSAAVIEKHPSSVMKQLAQEAIALLADCNMELSQVAAIGIGCPGLLNTQAGIVLSAANLGHEDWKDVKLAAGVGALLDKPCVLEGDGTCATAAEYWIGAGKSMKPSRFALLTLGTGVGGGLVINGNVMPGWVEPGHIIFRVGGRLCGCGQKGCLERYCSAAAVARNAQERLDKGEKSSLSAYNKVQCSDVFAEAAKGDVLSKEVFNEAVHALALGCLTVMRIIDPQVMAMSGGMTLAGPVLFDAVNAEIRRLAWKLSVPITVVPAEVGNQAGFVGAAYAAMKSTQISKL